MTVATAATSMAQVYSANAVGYVNITVQQGFNIIANPLNQEDNNVNTILPLPAEGENAQLYRWDPVAQNYLGTILLWIPEFGWFDGVSAEPAAVSINPGEAFFLEMPTSLNITFVGEVPQGVQNNQLYNGFNLVGSVIPQGLPPGDTAALEDGDLDFPAADGDQIYMWDAVNQRYLGTIWLYIAGEGGGWFDNVATIDKGPTIPVATGFFVQKVNEVNWQRDFSVN